MNREEMKNDLSSFYYLFPILLTFFFLFLIRYCLRTKIVFAPFEVRGIDSMGYFSQLRSLYFDHDLNVLSEIVAYFSDQWGAYFAANPQGGPAIPWVIGPALLWLPFYAMGHVSALVFNHLGAFYPINGFDFPFQVSICLGTMVYGLLGLALSFKLASRFVCRGAALRGTILIWIGSPFIFYFLIQPTMAHVPSMFALSAFLYYQVRSWGRKEPAQWAILGILAGLMVITRLESGAFLILVLSEFLAWFQIKSKEPKAWWPALLKGTIGFTAGFFIAMAPQMWAWDYYFGSPFKVSYGIPFEVPFLPGNRVTFDLLHPDIRNTFFSSYFGIVTCSPILVLSFAGLCLWSPKEPWLKFGVMAAISIIIWFTSCWEGKMGDTFGYRYLSQAAPIFIIGWASLYAAAWRSAQLRRAILLVSMIFAAWTFIFLIQSACGLAPQDRPLTYKEIFLGKWELLVDLSKLMP